MAMNVTLSSCRMMPMKTKCASDPAASATPPGELGGGARGARKAEAFELLPPHTGGAPGEKSTMLQP